MGQKRGWRIPASALKEGFGGCRGGLERSQRSGEFFECPESLGEGLQRGSGSRKTLRRLGRSWKRMEEVLGSLGVGGGSLGVGFWRFSLGVENAFEQDREDLQEYWGGLKGGAGVLGRSFGESSEDGGEGLRRSCSTVEAILEELWGGLRRFRRCWRLEEVSEGALGRSGEVLEGGQVSLGGKRRRPRRRSGEALAYDGGGFAGGWRNSWRFQEVLEEVWGDVGGGWSLSWRRFWSLSGKVVDGGAGGCGHPGGEWRRSESVLWEVKEVIDILGGLQGGLARS